MKKKKIIKKSEKKDRYEVQFKWVLIIMGIIVLITILTYFIIKSFENFEYAGIKFQKIMYDKLPLFYSKIPLYKNSGELGAYYNLYLRYDPRKLDIPVIGSIKLSENSILSADESINQCEDVGIAMYALSGFLKIASGNITLASTDRNYAEQRNITYATCDTSQEGSVIILKSVNNTSIYQEKPNCYIIEFKDCEIEKAVERFIVAGIANAQGNDIK